jgi:methylglutamate dehydrogenase subunit C
VSEQSNRLPNKGLVDRAAPIAFRFDNKNYRGFCGDTLASALLANGVTLVGRSFKYHRPRGILAAGSEEPNALVELRKGSRREPNIKATTIELFDGLEANSQNRWPSLHFDLLSLNSLLSPLFVAGFYYKTFMWPKRAWELLYEPFIRRAAGLGRASGLPDPDTYEKSHAHCDVLVIGAGRSGLVAALEAGQRGERVILADSDFRFGGRALNRPEESAGIETRLQKLRALTNVTLMPRTTVFGAYDGGVFGAVERVSDHMAVPRSFEPRQRLWKIIARRAILATGAIEQPIVFSGNDLPGVMLSSAVSTYLGRYGVVSGRAAVIFGSNDDCWNTACQVHEAGIRVAAIVDARPDVAESLRKKGAVTGAKILLGANVREAHGRQKLRRVEIVDAEGAVRHIDCDLLAVSGGWSPNLALTCHLGGKLGWDAKAGTVAHGILPDDMIVVGRAAHLPTDQISPTFRVRGGKTKAFVDLQHDVTDEDIELAVREGYHAVEHVKRYTTLGMATDQGLTAGVNGLAVLADARRMPIGEIGTTTVRPPYMSVAIGAFAGPHRGRDFKPYRLPPSHRWAESRGAVFVEAGQWLRAQYFPRAGETHWLQSVNREVTTVRSAVGVCDVSTLGKIDVQGDDAAEFLDRVYINGWKKLAVGRARYGMMLREDGFVMDDGTTARLANDRFFLTTTTANAGKVFQHLEFCHQVLWPALDVQLTSVSDQWAQFAVAGPHSRDTLAKIVDPGIDISDSKFPYMAAGEITVCGGLRARLFRVSFSGERAYELSIPARYGHALIERVVTAGAEFGITPYGTEALGVMRIEKGHAAGNELSGQTTATDLGFARMMSRTKDYIGRRMAERAALCDAERPSLVGLRPADPKAQFLAGAHLVAAGASATAKDDEGYVTSAAYSPTLRTRIALGLLANGPARIGERIRVVDPLRGLRDIDVEVCPPCFYDPEGAKLRD